MGLLHNQVVLVTGGARGQGRARAITSAREGADVVVLDVAGQLPTVHYPMSRPDDLEETVGPLRSWGGTLAFKADVRSQAVLDDAVARTLAEFGRLDALIVNHDVWSSGPFWELPEDRWNKTITVNMTGVWKSAKAVSRHILEQGSGSIVITSPVNGIEPGPGYAHYCAASRGGCRPVVELPPCVRDNGSDGPGGGRSFAAHRFQPRTRAGLSRRLTGGSVRPLVRSCPSCRLPDDRR